MSSSPVYSIRDIEIDTPFNSNDTYYVLRPNLKFMNSKYYNHIAMSTYILDFNAYGSNDEFTVVD